MAKTIKFNLILNNNPVRNIEELQNNFSIEDMIEYYNNGLLERWLTVRGYTEYLDMVKKINVSSNIELIKELIKIFNIESDEIKIEEGIAILNYISERTKLLEEYEKSNYKAKAVIADYHSGYYEVISDILENKDNMEKIKANIKEIEENYMGLLNLNYEEVYFKFIKNAPLAIFAMLMNSKMRSYFISNEDQCSSNKIVHDDLKKFLSNKYELKQKLGEDLRIFKGNTKEYWKDIEPQNKKFMILSMEFGNLVRSAGKFGEELDAKDVNNLFLILDGIDYKSNSVYDELLYMEV